jgi:hypothetical protein
MKRYMLALLIAGGAFVTAPRSSEAGLIPWTYNAIFGPGPAFGWRQAYYSGYAPYYSAGYAPYYGYRARYSASYAYGMPYYGGMNSSGCCGVANYTPNWGYGCCAPVNPCCGTCVGACDSGCGVGSNCSGCSVGAGTSEPPANSTPDEGATPTYAPKTKQPGDSVPPDEFKGVDRNLDNRRGGRGTEEFGGDGTGGVNSNSSAPPFEKPADAEPKSDPSDTRLMPPVEPINLDAKIAFRTPANFTRVHAAAKFRLPTVVRTLPTPPRDAEQVPTAVVAK